VAVKVTIGMAGLQGLEFLEMVVKLQWAEFLNDVDIKPKLFFAKVMATPSSGAPLAEVFSSSSPACLCRGSSSITVRRRTPSLSQVVLSPAARRVAVSADPRAKINSGGEEKIV
jgi:hypothetical protein